MSSKTGPYSPTPLAKRASPSAGSQATPKLWQRTKKAAPLASATAVGQTACGGNRRGSIQASGVASSVAA